MKHSKMKVDVEAWSPERATEILAKQPPDASQRKRRSSMVDKYARDMRAGQWVLTHQAVALGPDGVSLIDGQHRLMAIVESGVGQDLLTVRYSTVDAAAAALAATDIGGKRTVAEVLSISGVLQSETAKEVVAAVSALRNLFDPSRRDPSPEEIRSTYREHEEHVLWSIRALPNKCFTASIRAAFAFARAAFPEKVEEFADLIVSGEAPKDSPAQSWNKLMRDGRLASTGGGSSRSQVMNRVLRLIKAHVAGEGQLSKIYDSPESANWFRAKLAKKAAPP